MTKQEQQKSVHAMLKNRDLDEKEIRKLMSFLGKRRWADKTPEERSAHGKMMRSKRKVLSTD